MRIGLLTLLLCFSLELNAQIAISYFPFESVFSLASNTEHFFWADYKIETNTFYSNLNMELSPKFNFRRRPLINYYLGPGISFNPSNGSSNLPLENGYFLDIGTRIKPFSRFRGLQFVFELSPYVNREGSGGNLRARLGAAYNFRKRNGSRII